MANRVKRPAFAALTGTYMDAAIQQRPLIHPNGDRETALASDQRELSWNTFTRELIWVLISILLFLHLVTSYLFWAKLESAWPISP